MRITRIFFENYYRYTRFIGRRSKLRVTGPSKVFARWTTTTYRRIRESSPADHVTQQFGQRLVGFGIMYREYPEFRTEVSAGVRDGGVVWGLRVFISTRYIVSIQPICIRERVTYPDEKSCVKIEYLYKSHLRYFKPAVVRNNNHTWPRW